MVIYVVCVWFVDNVFSAVASVQLLKRWIFHHRVILSVFCFYFFDTQAPSVWRGRLILIMSVL